MYSQVQNLQSVTYAIEYIMEKTDSHIACHDKLLNMWPLAFASDGWLDTFRSQHVYDQ